MAKKKEETAEEKKTNKQRIKDGELLLRLVMEVAGSPKEHVDQAITLLVDKLEEKDYVTDLVSEEVFEATPHPQNEKIFTAIAELECWIKGSKNMVDLAFDFMPASIEIVEPEKPDVKNKDFSSLMNELMAKLHKSDMVVKNLSANKQVVERSMNVLLRNFIINNLKSGSKSLDDLAKTTGIAAEQLERFVGLLAQGGEIIKEKDLFALPKAKAQKSGSKKTSKKK
ncbi:hypothetical protein ACFL96_09040 [Thermoproteota archaeon]